MRTAGGPYTLHSVRPDCCPTLLRPRPKGSATSFEHRTACHPGPHVTERLHVALHLGRLHVAPHLGELSGSPCFVPRIRLNGRLAVSRCPCHPASLCWRWRCTSRMRWTNFFGTIRRSCHGIKASTCCHEDSTCLALPNCLWRCAIVSMQEAVLRETHRHATCLAFPSNVDVELMWT